ncbi:cupin domain-containing protein [Nocardia sp. CA-107356]|uniref:cupin domain-containing protein n=1 Tax=Nocardia sp. CA-107356 TaxID=3239972 RepID=UPI003D92E04C
MRAQQIVHIATTASDFRRVDERVEFAQGRDKNGIFPLASMAAGFVRGDAGYHGAVDNGNDEVLYVIDGRLDFCAGGHTTTVESGGFVYIPSGLSFEFTFGVPSVAFWVGSSSADIEQAMREMFGAESG